jgi:hypothetical protein
VTEPDGAEIYRPQWWLLSRHIEDEPYTVGRQFTAGLTAEVAAWCGGTVGTDENGQTVLDVPAHPDYDGSGGRAHLGDMVLSYLGRIWFWTETYERFQSHWASDDLYASWLAHPEAPLRLDPPFTITPGTGEGSP